MKSEALTPTARDRQLVRQLPHAYPFRLLDGARVLEPGRWVVGMKNVTRDDPLVDSAGVLAPVLLAEVMAQAAGLLFADPSAAAAPAMLAFIDRFRCCQRTVAGDQLLVSVRLVRRFGTMVKVRATVHVAGRPRAAAELGLHVAQPSRSER
jgi:3-hydroxyacyl-[acyl-carrier-protein] dehydratase